MYRWRLLLHATVLVLGMLVLVEAALAQAESLDSRIEAIEGLLKQGKEADALTQSRTLLAENGSVAHRDQAKLQMLLARVLTQGETDQDAIIAACGSALALLGKTPDPLATEAHHLRGLALTRKREPEPALADFEIARNETLAREGKESVAYANLLSDMSLAQRVAADYGASLTSLDQAIAIRKQQSPLPAAELARDVLRRGQTRRISGDLDGAESDYQQVLKLDDQSPDATGRNRAVVLYALGNLHRAREQAEQAIRWYSQAVPAFERAYGKDSVQLSQLYNNYGNAQSNLPGHEEAAIALFQRALDIAERNKSQNPTDYFPIANIAMVRIWQGRFKEAETGFRSMIARMGETPAGSESSLLFFQHGLAAALWGQGRHQEAFDAAAEAEATRQRAVREVASGLSDEQALAFQELDYATLDHALAIALDSKDPKLLERTWTMAIAARGQVTAIQAGRLTQARASSNPALKSLWEAWKQAGENLGRMQLSSDRIGQAKARTRMEHAERALAQAMPQADNLQASEIPVASLRSSLPDDSALIWFHDLRHSSPTEFANSKVDENEADTWAFVLVADQAAIKAMNLGPSGKITKSLEQWQQSLSTPTSNLQLLRAQGSELAKLVWTPLAREVKAKHLMILAEGPLLRLPWYALPDGGGFLVDGNRQFHLLNHERELLDHPTRGKAAHAMLAVADPRGENDTAQGLRGCTNAESLPLLPGARREVERLVGLLRTENADAQVIALIGPQASESRFREEAPQSALLHLATHGIEAGAACNNTGTRGISLKPEQRKSSESSHTALLFASVQSSKDSSDDGILGNLEIAALDLSRVQWAVLAACSTAAGATHGYEGLYGLARAFRLAGARTALLTLWPVDDQATAQWSEALYRARLVEKADTPTAMQQAQRAVLTARRAADLSDHPWYWAGFIAIGDWR